MAKKMVEKKVDDYECHHLTCRLVEQHARNKQSKSLANPVLFPGLMQCPRMRLVLLFVILGLLEQKVGGQLFILVTGKVGLNDLIP